MLRWIAAQPTSIVNGIIAVSRAFCGHRSRAQTLAAGGTRGNTYTLTACVVGSVGGHCECHRVLRLEVVADDRGVLHRDACRRGWFNRLTDESQLSGIDVGVAIILSKERSEYPEAVLSIPK